MNTVVIDGPPQQAETFTLLIGPPRSGTTLIANAVMAHSTVTGVMEPYQRGRNSGMENTDAATFLADFRSPGRNIVVKETCTRTRNAELSFELLQGARRIGLYTALVVILRCPFTAYLSQTEASRRYWSEKKLVDVSEETFIAWARMVRSGLRKICENAGAQHVRVVSYERFTSHLESELARIMAVIPEPLEARQLTLAPADGVEGRADPKVIEKAGQIVVSDRQADVDAVKERFARLPEMRFMTAVEGVVKRKIGQIPDSACMDMLYLACVRA